MTDTASGSSSGDGASPDGRFRVAMLVIDCLAARALFHAIDAAWPGVRVVLEPPVPRWTLIRGRIRRVGLRRTAGQLAFQVLVSPVLIRAARARNDEIVREARLDASAIPSGRVISVDSVNDPATSQAIRSLAPDVVVVVGTRIIGSRTLRSAEAPFVNLHAGITPRYRGVHGAYWALVEGRPQDAGATVHLVDEGVDTGAPLARVRIEPGHADTFATYPTLQLAAGVPALIEALSRIARGTAGPLEPLSGPSVLRYHPTIWEYLRARIRGVR